jgi:hypothetical protein
MTPAQHERRLVRILKEWKKRLKLDAWEIHLLLHEQPEDPDAMASIEPSDLYDHAILRFRHDWPTHPIEELNHIVVHELLHIMFRDYSAAARSIGVTGALTADARALWYDRCRDAEEGLVDRLANRLVEQAGIVE